MNINCEATISQDQMKDMIIDVMAKKGIVLQRTQISFNYHSSNYTYSTKVKFDLSEEFFAKKAEVPDVKEESRLEI
jgi:hypothetical protein